ncbi:hypothetical protein FGG79_19195 [Bacillus sp. BHET2]|uniref:hypothetical protein n=1 Tax=Bacillus sp. BHET2 TaxID=2583818 RepID=UPI00110D43DD|nr:hypothetical protein [Bacillus sp. BHET2]TMU83557.1 hypothetical protein FGG79_19195 [Bacillus sp. BHET2]
MEKKIFILVLIFILVACSNHSAYELPITKYPQSFQEEVSKLPEDIRDKMKVPTKFPFNVAFFRFSITPVYASVEYEPVDGELSDKVNLIFTTYYNDKIDSPKSYESIELSNGEKAILKKDEEELKVLEWADDGDVQQLAVMFRETKVTNEELKMMADSLITVK